MAFPFETTQLIAQLRVSYLTLTDNDEYAKRIIKPLITKGDGVEIPQKMHPQIEMQESPPITFNAARHVQKSSQNRNHEQEKRVGEKRRKGGRRTGKSERRRDHLKNKDDNVGAPEQAEIRPPKESRKKNSPVGLSYTQTITGKDRKRRTNIASFFHAGKRDSDSDSESDDSIRAAHLVTPERNLELIEEEMASDGEMDAGDSTDIGVDRNDRSDVITIDSDFDVPATVTGEGLKIPDMEFAYENQSAEDESESFKSDGITEDNGEKYDDFEEDEFDDEEDYFTEDEDEEVSSSDSAFTDIETDSILESSMLLDSYTDDPYNSYSFGDQNDNLSSLRTHSKKPRKKKGRSNSLESHSLSKISENLRSSSSQELLPSDYNNNEATNNKIGLNSSTSYSPNKPISRKDSFNFGKLDIIKSKDSPTKSKGSNLSALIQSKSKSSNVNPLNYYLFASSHIDSIHKAQLNIFLPPKTVPVISNLPINDNVAISDCIGYILLNLSNMSNFDKDDNLSYINPNNWRLELVDEDGENYGSFGILDRTRLLSSYNNPKDIAVCKVDDTAEIARNEKQAPLPLEFKSSLSAYTQRQSHSLGTVDTTATSISKTKPLINDSQDTVEMKILKNIINEPLSNAPSDYSVVYIKARAQIGQLLKEFCSENGLEMSKYRLREIILHETSDNNPLANRGQKYGNSLLQSNIGTRMSPTVNQSKKLLNENDLIIDLQSNTLELVECDTNQTQHNSDYTNESSSLNIGITPSESTCTLPAITPPIKQLEEKFQLMNVSKKSNKEPIKSVSTNSAKRNTTENIKRTLNSNKYLDNILTGKNPQLPTNINTIYFTWKVWRKKTTILNKIEKSLVIDGDYIHLTPSDVMVWKKNPSDNPFLSGHHNQSHSNHHHHYLHHYNYSNYYNSSMMKTSSFHITQITKLKQYKNSKNPNHFKIVIKKHVDASSTVKDSTVKKKYDLEAANVVECEEIIKKLKWVLQVYNMSKMTRT